MIETSRLSQNGFNFLTIRVEEPLTGDLVGCGMALLNNYPEFGRGIPVLWDLRASDLSRYTTRDMEETNAYLAQYPGRLNVKSASLLLDEGALFLARLWSVYRIEQFPQERKAFLKFEDAVAWLAAD
ncbi:hypothetical protein [Nisaea sediminum]|uniref:hypothetical protein n=1 Tax=Nisaea sediminum TaxID=2775867 RepID=UPI0018691DE9|nr:hypothetical protein [Nisaea sediminum]